VRAGGRKRYFSEYLGCLVIVRFLRRQRRRKGKRKSEEQSPYVEHPYLHGQMILPQRLNFTLNRCRHLRPGKL